MSRIEPLTPPYTADVDEALRKWMPPGVTVEPLRLFRVLQHHPQLASRMRVLGAGLLAHGALPALDREIVIARTCARCDCHYEWTVHATVYAEKVGLTVDQLQATVAGQASWTLPQRILIQAVDELHDTAQLTEQTWQALRDQYDAPQLLEIIVLTGWYRTISYVANGLLIEDEPWATPYPG
jgi:alkylhydroperoxidase family enzyme